MVWERVKQVVAEALRGETRHTRLEIHEGVRDEMERVWSSWKTSLDAKDELSRHFLAAALTRAGENAFSWALAMRWATTIRCAASSGSRSVHLSTSAIGTISA